MKIATLLALAGLAAASAAPAAPAAKASAAARPTANRDVRCLILSNMYAKVAAADAGRQAAAQARLFYLGRVSGKLSGAQIASVMEAEAKTVVPDKTGAEMNACSTTVRASASAVEAAGAKVRAAIGVAGPPAAGPSATVPAAAVPGTTPPAGR